MTPRTLKLLTASTAFIAASSLAHADTISTSVVTTQYTSATTGGFTVTGTGRINTTSGAAIEINSTNATSNTIYIQQGATVGTSSGVTATIQSVNAANGAVSITNAGTINASGGTTSAIYLNDMSANVDIVNNGNISGSIVMGQGTNNFTSTGNTNGNLFGDEGNDTITFTNATHNGNIDYVSGSDIIVVNNSTINGNISNSGVTGITQITLTNATLNGEINDSSPNDGDILTINGTRTFTTGGNISGMETVNFNANSVVNHQLIGAQTVNIAANKTVEANRNFNVGGTLTNSGTLNIAANSTVTANTYSSTGGVVGIHVSNSTQAGKLAIGTGTVSAGNTSFTINLAETSGYISNGTSYTIVAGQSGTASGTLINNGTAIYRYGLNSNGQDLDLIVNRVATESVATGADAKGVAKVLDQLGASSTNELDTLQGIIGSKATAAGVQAVLESLSPNIDGAGIASVNFAVDAGNQVSNRLASLRNTGYGEGVATGDGMANSHMWVQGFGSMVEQDDKDGARGYDANSAGASIGLDTDTLVNGVTTGLAVTYGKSKVDSNASGGASTDIDTYAATLYGSRVMDNGVFFNGQLGYGANKYEMTRNIAGIGQTKGETDGWQGTAKLETGRDFAFGGLTLTPLASVQYTYLDMDGYTETGAGGASLRVNPDAMSTVDAGIGAEASYAFALSDGGTLKPSIRAKYIHRMGDESMATTSQFTGGGASFVTNGVKADMSSVNVGAGLLLNTVGGTDFSLDYDADIRSSLIGHTGQVKARWAF